LLIPLSLAGLPQNLGGRYGSSLSLSPLLRALLPHPSIDPQSSSSAPPKGSIAGWLSPAQRKQEDNLGTMLPLHVGEGPIEPTTSGRFAPLASAATAQLRVVARATAVLAPLLRSLRGRRKKRASHAPKSTPLASHLASLSIPAASHHNRHTTQASRTAATLSDTGLILPEASQH
jgi:hypothetical protein